MRFIKFNTKADAQAVCDRVFAAANNDGKFAQGTTSYATPQQEDYFTVPVLDGFDAYFTNQELSGVEAFAELKQGRLVYDDLRYQLKQQALTTAQMLTLGDYIINVITYLIAGDLRAARLKANNLATTTLYTAARKSWLLARIDTEIALL